MKRGKLMVLFFGLILFVSLISASTTVHVKTLPRQDFYMTPILVGDGFNAITPPQFYSSDEYGDLVIILENITTNQFSLFFTLKDDAGVTTYRQKMETAFLTGTDVNVTVAPVGANLLETPTIIYYPEPVVNTTLTNLTNLTTSNSSNLSANLTINSTANNTNDSNIVPVKKVKKSQLNESLINGDITDASTGDSNNTLWYIIGAVVLVGIVVFLFLGRKSSGGLSPYSRGIEAHYERELSKAKKEFRHAKDNLELLRGKKEIVAVERKIESDRKQLETLLAKENKKFK